MQRFSQRARQMRFSAVALALAILLGITAEVRAATFTVNTTADNTTASDGFCTLREAILAANNTANSDCGTASTADDNITFSVSGTITLGSQLPDIANASTAGKLTIDGTGQNITISGNNLVRVFQVLNGADLTLKNLTISNGKASLGGGIFNAGTLTLTNSTLSNNFAGGGGGILNTGSGTVTITNSTLSNNSAADGGGIANIGTVTITNSTLSGNSAGQNGGGIFNDYGTVTLTNSTLSGNSANIDGGGIDNDNTGTVTIANSTLSGNSAGQDGGGIDNDNAGTVTIKNSIVANSTSGGNCSGTITDGGNNLDSAATCGFGGGSLSNTNPNLGSLTGSPAHFPLNSGSLAIDAGDNATCAAAPVSNQSQNGAIRPQDGDGDGSAVCDIGSYEAPSETVPPSVTVDQAAGQPDPTNTTPIHFTTVFSEAINPATFTPSDVTLSGTAPGATVTSITTSDNITFDISVSGMTGSGTVTASIAAGVVQDTAGNGNTASTSTDNTVTYDVGAPVVASTSLQAAYTNSGPGNFTVTFSEAVQDPPGNGGQDDVTNPANYLLIDKGADNIPNTASCAGGVAGDDSALTVSSVSYNAATFTSTVTLASAPGVGAYRLFVCGTTSIVDLGGTPLNGGADYTFDFVVTPSPVPLLPTPGALAALLALLVAIGLRGLRRV